MTGEAVHKVGVTANGKAVSNSTNVTVDSDAINKDIEKLK